MSGEVSILWTGYVRIQHTIINICSHILRCQPSTTFKQEPPLPSPPLLNIPRRNLQPLPVEVVQHDDVCASCNRLICALLTINLDLDLQRKAASSFRRLDRLETNYLLQTYDDPPAHIVIKTHGWRTGPPEILAQLADPELADKVDPNSYKFRIFIEMETGDERYRDRLNCGMWVGSGMRKGLEVIYE